MFMTKSDKIPLKQQKEEFGPGSAFRAPTPSKADTVSLKKGKCDPWTGFNDPGRQTKADEIPLKKGGKSE